MKRLAGILCLALAMGAPWAYADVPDAVLDQEYQSCTGGQNDPDRNTYCACVRDGMRHWDEQSFMEVAQAAIAANGAQQLPPAKLDALAKACIAQVLH